MDRVNVEAYHEFQGGSIVVLPPGARPLFDTAVALAAGPEPDQFHVAVTSNGGQQQHSASLFVTSGRTGAVLTGSERLVARRNAVEVAQHVGARQPDVEALFEGVALTLRVSKLADGRLAYVTFGQQSSNERLYPSTANSAGGGGLLALTAAHLGLDAQGTVKPGARGGWTIVLGDETGDGQSLTLEVREAR